MDLPAHIPNPQPLAKILRHWFRLQKNEVMQRFRAGIWNPPTLAHWSLPMAEAIINAGFMQKWFARGMRLERRAPVVSAGAKSYQKKKESPDDFTIKKFWTCDCGKLRGLNEGVLHCHDCDTDARNFVRIVKGGVIRSLTLDEEEFGNFATCITYPDDIPDCEIWIDECIKPHGWHYFVINAVAQFKAKRDGCDEDTIYDRGLTAERKEREKDTQYESEPSYDDMIVSSRPGPNGTTIDYIDGHIARNHYKTDYTQGGHWLVYPWIQTKHFAIEDGMNESEKEYVTFYHEIPENGKMDNDGWGYDESHKYASNVEFAKRKADKAKAAGVLTKSYEPPIFKASVGIGFDVFNPQILEYIRTQTFNFCEETNQTASKELGEAIEDLRRALGEGQAEGQSGYEFTQAVSQIFTDPQRAARIAVTEAARASCGGQVLQMQESEIVTAKRWLAHAGACPICEELDGNEIPIDATFYVHAKGNPAYRMVMHPPAHPFCLCALQSVI